MPTEYEARYWVGVCIQRMDLCRPVEDFLTSGLVEEIRGLREDDHRNNTGT